MTQFIYDTYEEAVLRAQDMRERLEFYTRPIEVIGHNKSDSVHLGWALEFDLDGAARHAQQDGVIVSVCMCCGRTLGEKNPQGSIPGVSHGICTRCAENIREEMMRL